MSFACTKAVIKRFFGRRCIVCGEVHSAEELELECCSVCKKELYPVQKGFCPGCGLVYPSQDVHLCSDCRQEDKPWSDFGFFNEYAGMLKDLIIDFKFNKNLGLSRLLQRLVYSAYLLHIKDSPDLLVPVPLHPQRLLQRGFNQSKELAGEISRQENIQIDSRILERTKNTKSQVGLSRQQRAENLALAITAGKKQLNARHVLLVDDIYTTGSTVKSCAHALNFAGAKRVDVLVLARVMDQYGY